MSRVPKLPVKFRQLSLSYQENIKSYSTKIAPANNLQSDT